MDGEHGLLPSTGFSYLIDPFRLHANVRITQFNAVRRHDGHIDLVHGNNLTRASNRTSVIVHRW